MWWISYRGEGKAGVDNIGVFEDDGTPRKEHPLLLDPSPKAHPLHIARGFALVGDDLYIANAWRKDSHVARYHRHGDTFHFAEVVVTTKHISAMVHPFDVEFGDDGRLYVSCQDTNTVLAILPKTRKPAPVPRIFARASPTAISSPARSSPPARAGFLNAGDRRAGGRPVAAGPQGGARRARQAPTLRARHHRASQASLRSGRSGERRQGLRAQTGRLVARIRVKKLAKPVHLILHGDTLYIGAAGTGSILAYDIPKEAPRGKLKARVVIDGKLKAPSGFAIGPDGDLYVAERFDQRVRRFSIKGRRRGRSSTAPGHAGVPGAHTGSGVKVKSHSISRFLREESVMSNYIISLD